MFDKLELNRRRLLCTSVSGVSLAATTGLAVAAVDGAARGLTGAQSSPKTMPAAAQGDDGGLAVPARIIPVPRSVSAEAQAYLAAAAAMPSPPEPQTADKEAWRRYVADGDAALLPLMQHLASGYATRSETLPLGPARVYRITPDHRPGRLAEVACLDIHGGSLVAGGGELCRLYGMKQAGLFGAQLYAVDYRMAPDNPYPAPLDDCLAAYREMLKAYRPADIIVAGASAGGNLAAAMLLRARDEGLPLPAGLLLMSPELDLTESGDTFETNQFIDVVLIRRLTGSIALHANGHDLRHPYLSPLFGDFTKGFPPTFLTSGTRDMFLSNVVRMYRNLRRAGVPAELCIGEAMPHAGFMGTVEDRERDLECRRFAHAAWRVPA